MYISNLINLGILFVIFQIYFYNNNNNKMPSTTTTISATIATILAVPTLTVAWAANKQANANNHIKSGPQHDVS